MKLFLPLLLLTAACASAQSVFQVTNLNSSGAGSLRQAIESANANADASVITFSNGSGGSVNFHDPAAPKTIPLGGSELLISQPLEIVGPGSDLLALSGGSDGDTTVEVGESRVFRIENTTGAAKVVTLRGLTIRDGIQGPTGGGGGIFSTENLTLTDCRVTSCIVTGFGPSGGGGILSRTGTLRLERCRIDGNQVAGDASGGGISAEASTLLMFDSEVSDNGVGGSVGQGGGVTVNFGSATIERSRILRNRTTGNNGGGGGMTTFGSTLRMTDTLIDSNSVRGGLGGGAFLSSGNSELRRCTFSRNTTELGAANGGGLALGNDGALLEQCTISDNSVAGATANGGACLVFSSSAGRGNVTFTHCTITGNTAAPGQVGGIVKERGIATTIAFGHCIVAGNSGADFGLVNTGNNNGFTSLGWNAVGPAGSTAFVQPGDQRSTADPRLAPLADNGGPVPTREVLPDSPAFAAGNPAFVPTGGASLLQFDQRGSGFPRIVNRIEIGAFEVQNKPPVAMDDGPYRVAEDRTLQVPPATGVLANDTDPETGGGVANLDALLVTPPAHGQLALAADGSFVYTPAKNYFGDDFFTYLADDRQSSNNTSPPATVRLVVEEESDLAVAVAPLRESLVSESPAREAFRVTVTNRGPSRVTGLRLAELAASDAGSLVVTGRTASAGLVQSSTGIWTLDLDEGASAELRIEARITGVATAGATASFRMTVSSADQPLIAPFEDDTAVATLPVLTAGAIRVATTGLATRRQTGLVTGRITLANLNLASAPALRVYVTGLPAGVRVYNATGSAAIGDPPVLLPYLEFNQAVAASTGEIIMTIEFLDPLRRATLSPGYLVEILPEPAARPPAQNTGFAARGPFPQPNGGKLIEWNAEFGRRYAVQYSDDMTSWHQVEPTVTAPANRVQWVDDGPPKTASHPGTVAQRYYRIVELPPPG